jgi:hypothetical protein
VGDGENLLTYLNLSLKVLSGLDIFPCGPKKKLNFVDQCNKRQGSSHFMFMSILVVNRRLYLPALSLMHLKPFLTLIALKMYP